MALLLIVLPGVSNESNWARAQEQATFYVESLRIENAERTQLAVIQTESRLATGKQYTEAELQAGRNRIVQLPFVTGADFSLERGTEPGRFVLVIEIVEAKKWFFAFDLSTEFLSDDVSTTVSETTNSTSGGAAFFGRRFFLGRAGVLTTALGGEAGDLHVQYAQYDLFGKGMGLTTTYEVGFCDSNTSTDDDVCSSSKADLGTDPTFSVWSHTDTRHRFVNSLTVPLARSHSLLAEIDFRTTAEGFKRPAIEPESQEFFRFEGLEELEVRFGWLNDTLDDPVTPLSGLRVETSAVYRRTAGEFQLGLDRLVEAPAFDTKITELGLSGSLAKYWPVRSYAFLVVGDLYVGRASWRDLPIQGELSLTDDATALRASVGVGHAVNLWRSAKPGKFADLRLETDLSVQWDGTSPSGDLANTPSSSDQQILALREANPLRSYRVRSALVYRNRRAVLRFSLGYRELFFP